MNSVPAPFRRHLVFVSGNAVVIASTGSLIHAIFRNKSGKFYSKGRKPPQTKTTGNGNARIFGNRQLQRPLSNGERDYSISTATHDANIAAKRLRMAEYRLQNGFSYAMSNSRMQFHNYVKFGGCGSIFLKHVDAQP